MLVVKGSDFAVSGASAIARYFGMSERFIGLTIVALGTSLPELVTSVTAARKGNAGIAIGNIVGSNIFNILFVIGTTALICTVPFESKFIIDTIIAVVVGVASPVCGEPVAPIYVYFTGFFDVFCPPFAPLPPGVTFAFGAFGPSVVPGCSVVPGFSVVPGSSVVSSRFVE